MSLFDELKRRNVFRVGAAYAVAAWIILQLTDVVGEILELPAWGGKLILALVVIGFFMALILAWAYELTPEGVKREAEVDPAHSVTRQTGRRLDRTIIVLLALAVAYLLFDKFYLQTLTGSDSSAAAPQSTSEIASAGDEATPGNREPATEVSRQSIAVLPFDNRSRLDDDAFFVEGIHDDLLTTLARIDALKVISRTSVGRYADTEKSIPEIAAELGVATVMEGAVQRSGDTVRINVQLIDAATDEHLWAEIYDRDLTADNLFAIQSEISEQIARALQATLSPEEERRLSERPTDNLAAYNAYLLGRQLMVRRSSSDLEAALAEFRRAVELDPDFALAWVGIAESAGLLLRYGSMDWMEALNIGQEAVDRALALDDQLGEAHLVRAEFMQADGRLVNPEVDRAYQKAIELSPNYASAYHWYADYIDNEPQRLREARMLLQKALELDPLSPSIRQALAFNLLQLGQRDEALAELEELLALDPDFAPAFAAMARIQGARGRMDQQVLWIYRAQQKDPGNMGLYMDLLFALTEIGDQQAIADLKESIEAMDQDNYRIAWLEMVLAMERNNVPAALEQNAWVYERMGRAPFVKMIEGYLHMMVPDYPRARAAMEIALPEFFDRATWPEAIRKLPGEGCGIAWVLMNTGDEALGRELLAASSGYLLEELPRYVDHADRWGPEICHLAAGDHEAALDAIERALAHRHFDGWFFYTKQKIFDPLWDEPRFISAMDGMREEMARQRASLRRLEAQEPVDAGP